MPYDIIVTINENSAEAHKIEATAEREYVSREEAVVMLLKAAPVVKPLPASPEALQIIGLFRDEADLVDEVLEIAMEERRRRNSALGND